ncbi:MAG: DNA-binding protein [Spirochaetes bacterium]|nr:MAG: DNA-binding protein [Spirochaetota bacterium]
MDSQLKDLIQAVKTATKEWLTPSELQEEFGISTSTQAKMRVSRAIPYHKISKYVRYKRADINAWFDSAKVV